jgi:hypothetical protein
VNVAEGGRTSTESNEILHTEHNPRISNSQSVEVRSENNEDDKNKVDKAEMKNILKNYIKQCLPKHLVNQQFN